MSSIKTFLFVALAAFAVSVKAEGGFPNDGVSAERFWKGIPDQEYVVKLDDKNFNTYIASVPNTLVEFLETGCSTCQDFRTTWANSAKTVYHDDKFNVQLAAFNCFLNDKTGEICDNTYSSQITGYPTMLLFVNGEYNTTGNYDDMWDSGDLEDWLVQQGYSANSTSA